VLASKKPLPVSLQGDPTCQGNRKGCPYYMTGLVRLCIVAATLVINIFQISAMRRNGRENGRRGAMNCAQGDGSTPQAGAMNCALTPIFFILPMPVYNLSAFYCQLSMS
jgi:hypothetical protein